MRKNLQIQDLGDLLEQARCATLATYRRDGTAMLSPVWHEWRDGSFTVLALAQDIKVRHLRRNPRASIVVAEDTPPYRGIEVRGQARLLHEGAQETVHRLAVRYLDPTQGKAFADAMGRSELVLIRIEPGVLRVWDFADEF
jgi:PPOX class probable F420-dependent enzyme